MIELIDRHYGRIIDALDEMGLRENTIVIFNSDHGEMPVSYTHLDVYKRQVYLRSFVLPAVRGQ